MIIDTHTHYHHRRFDSDRNTVLENIYNAGVSKIIEVPISYESNEDVISLSVKYPWVFHAVGIHPNQTVLHEKGEMDILIECIKSYAAKNGAAAVGEIGLDYKRVQEEKLQAYQREWFARFIELASELDKPMILHVREAAADALDILRSFRRSFSGVVHCFSEDYDISRQYMDMGFAIGVGGSLTYGTSENVRDAVKKVPADMILLETDAPFLTPAGCTGKNTSCSIPTVVSVLAQIRREECGDIIRQTAKNAERIFGI